MYIPKYQKVSLPILNLGEFNLNPEYIPEIKNIMLRCWEAQEQWIFKRDKDFYNYHRGPLSIFGDAGYIRVAAFTNAFLNSVWKGRTILSLLPDAENLAVADNLGSINRESDRILDNKKIFLTKSDNATFRRLAVLPAFQDINARLIKIDEVRELVDSIGAMTLLDSDSLGATLVNTLIFYIKVTKLIWLNEVEVDDAGLPKQPACVIKYKTYDLFDILLDEDFQNLFLDVRLADDIDFTLQSLSDLSTLGRLNSFTSDGFKLLQSFFSQYTTKVLETAIKVTEDRFILSVLFSEFLNEVERYSNVVRLKRHRAELMEINPKADDSVLIFRKNLQPVDVSPSKLYDFIIYFEDRYKDILPLWSKFVERFFVKAADLRGKGTPILSGKYADVSGVSTIYSLNFDKPYGRSGFFVEEYKDGIQVSGYKSTAPNPSKERLEKTRVVDLTYIGVNYTNLTSDVPKYFEVLLNCRQNLLVKLRNTSSTEYLLEWDNVFNIIVPPINPKTNYKLSREVIKFGFPSDPEVFMLYNIPREAIKIEMLPFIIKASDFSIRHNSLDSNSSLEQLFEDNFLEAFNGEGFGFDHLIVEAATARSSVISLSALLVTRNVQSSDQLLKYLTIKVDYDNLNPRKQGGNLAIPKNLLIPFGFSMLETSDEQLSTMRNNRRKGALPLLIDAPVADDILLSSDVQVFASVDYSLFSDLLKLGVVSLRIGEHLYTDKLSLIDKGTNEWVYRVFSSTDRVSNLVKSYISYDGRLETDFYDPWPMADDVSSIFNALACCYTELSNLNTLNRAGVATDDFSHVKVAILDIYKFCMEYFDQKGLIYTTGNVQIAKTWGDFCGLLQPTLEACFSNSELNVLLNRFTDFLLQLRDNKPFFWNNVGYRQEKFYFGDMYLLLVDKFIKTSREPLPDLGAVDVRYLPTPPSISGATSSNYKATILSNLDVYLSNLIGRFLYSDYFEEKLKKYGDKHDSIIG